MDDVQIAAGSGLGAVRATELCADLLELEVAVALRAAVGWELVSVVVGDDGLHASFRRRPAG